MDDTELAEMSKKQDIIIVFAFGNKYARQLDNITEKKIKSTLDRLTKKIVQDWSDAKESPQSKTFIINVVQGPTGTPCPERTCIHEFHSDAVMTDHVRANHPDIFAKLVAQGSMKEPKVETKTVTYL